MLEVFYKDYKELKEKYNKEGKEGNYYFKCDGNSINEYFVKHTHDKNKKENEESQTVIHFGLLPQPLIGDVENAKIIICSLNPGFSADDYNADELHHNDILEQLNPDNHNKTLFWLTEKPDDKGNLSGGAKWWQGKLDQKDKEKSLVYNIIKEYKSDVESLSNEELKKEKEKVFKVLSENMAAIELFPYHSAKFNYTYLKNCESTKKIIEYVKELAENSQKSQLICFTRSFKYWKVNEIKKQADGNDNVDVIRNPSVQNISFNIKNKDFGGAIFEHIKKHLIEDSLK